MTAMDWSVIVEIGKTALAYFGGVVLILGTLYKLVKKISQASASPPNNSISGVVLQMSAQFERLARKFLEMPVELPIKEAQNPAFGATSEYTVSQYIFDHNKRFTLKPLGRFIAVCVQCLIMSIVLVRGICFLMVTEVLDGAPGMWSFGNVWECVGM